MVKVRDVRRTLRRFGLEDFGSNYLDSEVKLASGDLTIEDFGHLDVETSYDPSLNRSGILEHPDGRRFILNGAFVNVGGEYCVEVLTFKEYKDTQDCLFEP